jgi:hypothetical protein
MRLIRTSHDVGPYRPDTQGNYDLVVDIEPPESDAHKDGPARWEGREVIVTWVVD